MNKKTESKQEKAASVKTAGARPAVSQGVIILLNWLAVIATAILLACIYIPRSIWAEEDQYRTESQRRMQIIQKAEDFFNTIRGGYTEDGEFLFKLISQTHDSLIADTTFVGDQIVNVDGEPVSVFIPEQQHLGVQMDTSFTVGRQLRQEVLDTVYTITSWNIERAANDTSYVNGSAALAQRMEGTDFREVVNTSYGSHTEVYTDYKWNRYRLEPELLLCPVTGEPYIIKIDTVSLELTIASPIYEGYTEPRYFIFEFQALDHGEIIDGNPSWTNQ